MSDIRNQLQTLTGADILASQLSSVGGKVFTNAEDSQDDFKRLVDFWVSIHAPTNGQPIPGSAGSAAGSGDGTMYAPDTNETALIQAIEISNPDPVNPITNVSVNITDGTNAPCIFFGDIQANSAVCIIGFQGTVPFDLVSGQELIIGNATGANWSVAYALKVQG